MSELREHELLEQVRARDARIKEQETQIDRLTKELRRSQVEIELLKQKLDKLARRFFGNRCPAEIGVKNDPGCVNDWLQGITQGLTKLPLNCVRQAVMREYDTVRVEIPAADFLAQFRKYCANRFGHGRLPILRNKLRNFSPTEKFAYRRQLTQKLGLGGRGH